MMRGVAFAADAVKKAYGPNGGMVEIQVPSGQARYTRRGDLIMGALAPSDEVEARGANMLKLAAGPAIGNFGDGVITTSILSEYILREGEKNVAAGADPFYLQHGIDLAVRAATGHLWQHAQRSLTPDQIISIGAIAADNDWELGTSLGRMINDGTAPTDIRLVKTFHPAVEVYDPYTLYVGPTPEIDVEERFVRAQTALHSLGGAFEEGVVAGGGAALLHAADALNGLAGTNETPRFDS
jgi:chaperonin GroEL